ncbi:MAG: TonB-dependent receptor, partial [Acidobacteriaceae bacterium]|nr:TonB-dependent receptor [Acidobacteriaceae bacterium]
FLLNGVDNNVNVIDFLNQSAYVVGPSVEAIGEMTVLTNGYNAEYGRAAGGVMNVNLKSGTNEVHGVLFEILQNTVLDANRWENNAAGAPRNPFKQNQFGAAVGGPIIKNKLFIFGDYQGTRIASAGGTIQNLGYGGFFTIPTQAMVHGDFSSLLPGLQLYDPTTTTCTSGCVPGTLTAAAGATPVYTRAAFPNNQIPVSKMDPASMKIAALYPATNQPIPAGTYPQNDYYTVTPGGLVTDQGDGRVDYRFSDKSSIFGSISWSNTYKTSVPPFVGALDGGDFNGSSEQDLGRNAQLSYTHIWTPTIISESRIGFSRLVTARTQANANTDEFKAVGMGGYDPTTTLNGGLPQIHFNDTTNTQRYRQVGANDWLPTKEYNNVWDFIQNVAITKGTHSMKFGAEFRPIHFPFFQVPYPHGELNFNQNDTAFPSTVNNANAKSGDPFASFLIGAVGGGQISTTNFISSTKQAYAFYAQDDWKLTPKLTLNIGVRYELFSPIGEQFARQSNFVLQDLTLYIPRGPNQDAPLPPNFSQPVTINGNTYPALYPNVKVDRGHVSPYLIPWDKFDIGPRLGFAYNILPKTVLRGAYGVFYGGEENQGGNPNRGESAPFNESPNLDRPPGVGTFQPNPNFGGGTQSMGVTDGYPTNVFTTFPVTSLQFREVAPDFRNPMVQKWNLAIQQELPGQMALEISYVGNHSSHQLQ